MRHALVPNSSIKESRLFSVALENLLQIETYFQKTQPLWADLPKHGSSKCTLITLCVQ